MAISKPMKQEKGHELSYHEGGPLLLHDADWIAYAVGSVCQTLIQTVSVKGEVKFEAESKTELYEQMGVKDKAEMEDRLANDKRWKHVTFEERIELEPIENCLHSVNMTIQRIIDDVGAGDQKMWITQGNTNFRNDIATLKKYKANRSGVERPHYYDTIREHMIEYHGAIIATGMEAEDPVVTEHYQAHDKWLKELPKKIQMGLINPLNPEELECPVIMVSVDKDTFQSAGQHYNPKTEELRWISEFGSTTLKTRYKECGVKVKDRSIKFDGLKGLYLQMLQGDDIDNIPGIKGYGPVKLYETIEPLKTERELYETVLKCWEDYVPVFMAEQDVEDEIRKQNWDYSFRGANAKDITAFRKKAKAARMALWKKGAMDQTFQYYKWDCFVEDEFGAPTLELKPGKNERMEVEPYDLLLEVATLLWIRHYEVAEGEYLMAPLSKFRHGL